jgi:hypothetical protein
LAREGSILLVRRSAEMGYAPAQRDLSVLAEERVEDDMLLMWAERAAAQGFPHGILRLSHCYRKGFVCDQDEEKALELLRQAAELGCPKAQGKYGTRAYSECDWRRYHWWVLAAIGGYGRANLIRALAPLIPSFERGENGRILHTLAPVVKAHFLHEEGSLFGIDVSGAEYFACDGILWLHGEMLGRAREALDCWSIVGRRCRVVKDIRVMIAKMAWEEVWLWGEKE